MLRQVLERRALRVRPLREALHGQQALREERRGLLREALLPALRKHLPRQQPDHRGRRLRGAQQGLVAD